MLVATAVILSYTTFSARSTNQYNL